jgi:hypothetical protein
MAYLFYLLHPSVLDQPSLNDALQYPSHHQTTGLTRHLTMQWNAVFGSKGYIGFVVCLTIFTDVLTYGVIVRTILNIHVSGLANLNITGPCDAACAALSSWRQARRLAEMEHGFDDFLCRHDLRWFRYVQYRTSPRDLHVVKTDFNLQSCSPQSDNGLAGSDGRSSLDRHSFLPQ